MPVSPQRSVQHPVAGLSTSSSSLREARIALVVTMLTNAALGCGCRKDQTCPVHTFSGFTGGIRLVVEDAVFEALAVHVGVWTKESWIKTVCYSSAIDSTSQNSLYRRMMDLRSDIRDRARIVHNAWMSAGQPESYPLHDEGCLYCIDPNVQLDW